MACQQTSSPTAAPRAGFPCCWWRQKEQCCVGSSRTARSRWACSAIVSFHGNRRGRSQSRGARRCETCSLGSPRLIPGPPVQGHCSVLTMADGDDSQSNKSWLHTHTYCFWQLPAFLGILFMETWTAVVSVDQCHVAAGILQRLSVE